MKFTTTCVILSGCLSLAAADGPYNTWHGFLSGEGTVADRSTMIGAGAGADSKSLVRSTFLGAGAGAKSQQLTGCVGIGFGVLSNTNGLTDVTAINGHIYAGNGKLHIKADKNAADASSVIHYENGTLTLNADTIVTPSGAITGNAPAGTVEKYDLYLSPDGDDANDGRTALSPKRTFDGCFAAATTNMTVGVLPGTYLPPSNAPCEANGQTRLIVAPYSLEFTAIGGKDKTFIVGQVTNDLGYADGYYHTLAFNVPRQAFKGFTIRGIKAFSETVYHASTRNSSPAISVCNLYDCVVEDCTTPVNGYLSAFNSLYCSNTVFRSIGLICDYASVSAPAVMVGCDFHDCQIKDISVLSSAKYYRYFDKCSFLNSLVILPHQTANEVGGNWNQGAVNSTFIWPDLTITRGQPEYATDCYFCVGTGYTSTNGVRNAYAPSWTNTYLNAEYVPAYLDCPAIRNDETPDAGWKNSGLSHLKKLYKPQQLYISDSVTGSNYVIRVENGEIKVYHNED